MAYAFLTNLDMSKNQILNALFQVLASDPAGPADGQFWFRSDDKMPRFRAGATTRRLAEIVAGGAVTATHNTDGTVTVTVTKASVDALGIDAASVGGHATPAAGNAAAAEVVLGTDTRLTDTRTPKAHVHAQADVTGLTTALAGKSDTGHTHTLADVTDAGTAAAANLPAAGNAATTEVVKGDDTRLSDARTPTTHSHPISQVTGLQTALDGKADDGHTHTLANITDAGTAAALDVAPTGNATTAQVVKGNDTRLTNARTPTAHKATHASGGSDVLTPADIGAAAASHTHTIAQVTSLQTTLDAKLDDSQRGAANGVASLGADGKVPTGQLPAAALGGLNYLGTWNAATNTPTLATGVGTRGDFYKVATAGNTAIDGISDWDVGDWIVYGGSAWEKVDNTDAVSSVAGRTGNVTLAVSDVANALDKTQNLNDLPNKTTARSNLGLGTSATLDVPAAGDATSGQVVKGNDSRLSGRMRRYAADVGGSTSIVVTHNLNTLDVIVQVFVKATGAAVGCDVEHTSVNTITLGFSPSAPTAASLRVVVMG